MAAFVYIMASFRNGTIYIGVTSDLLKRATAHREGLISRFTDKYGVRRLVYYELHEDIREAINREKVLKKRRRAVKISLIETVNPDLNDLYYDLL